MTLDDGSCSFYVPAAIIQTGDTVSLGSSIDLLSLARLGAAFIGVTYRRVGRTSFRGTFHSLPSHHFLLFFGDWVDQGRVIVVGIIFLNLRSNLVHSHAFQRQVGGSSVLQFRELEKKGGFSPLS